MNLEFFIRLKDMMSGGLAKLAQTANKTNAQIKGGNNSLAQSYDQITDKIKNLETAINKSTSLSHIRAAKKELADLQRMQTNHAGNTGGGGSWMGNLMRQALPMAGIAGAIALGGSMLTSGLEAQARSVSFNVMAGKQEGGRLNNDLTKYAQDSIYGNEVYQNAQTMMGFGINSKDIMPDMKMIGDIAMGDANKLQSLTLAFSQVSAAGKLTGQDLLQFVNAGFNPLQEIANKTGISLGTLKEAVSDGAISFDMVKAAFQGATSEGGRFFNMTEEIGKTDFGKWQAFQGQLAGFGMQLGGIIAPAFGAILNILSPILGLMGDFVTLLQANADIVGLVAVVLGAGAAAYGVFWLAMNAVTIATGIQTFVVGGASAAWAFLNLVMAANPIGLVVVAIAALVAGIIYAWNKFEGFRVVVYALWGAFKQVFTNIGEFFKKTFEPIFEAIQAFKEGRLLDAGKAILKLGYNLTVGAVKFVADGGLTKGVKEAAMTEARNGLNKPTSKTPSELATPAAAGVGGAYDALGGYKKGGSKDTDSVAVGATSGGPRVININGVRLAEKIEIHAQTFEKGIDDVEGQLEELLMRLLYSGAKLQS